jgi:hypothetical protein
MRAREQSPALRPRPAERRLAYRRQTDGCPIFTRFDMGCSNDQAINQGCQ